jgi:hypothetical protein
VFGRFKRKPSNDKRGRWIDPPVVAPETPVRGPRKEDEEDLFATALQHFIDSFSDADAFADTVPNAYWWCAKTDAG